MKKFQLKTLTELTSEEQTHIVAGSTADGGCKCTCTCSCCQECNASGIDNATARSETDTVFLG